MKPTADNLTFTCTDRLGETKSLEAIVGSGVDTDESESRPEKEHVLAHNRILIDKLNEFQVQINTLMTKFVEKEKEAVASKALSNEHLKKENLKLQNSSDEEDESSNDLMEADESQEAQCLKRNKEAPESDQESRVSEKKQCLNN